MADTDVRALLRSLNFVGEESAGGAPETMNLHEIFSEKMEKEKQPAAAAPDWLLTHMQGDRAPAVDLESENKLLRQRIISLENENNELKKQLSCYSNLASTPPPHPKPQPEAQLQMSPLLARCTTPTTPPPTLNHLSPSAPSFIPIGNLTTPVARSPTTHLTPSTYSPLAPTINQQQPAVTSPGKALVANVCRHWLVNRCTYGNDCRFVHPPQEHHGLHKVPATPGMAGAPKKGLKEEDVVTRTSPVRQLIPQAIPGRPNEFLGLDLSFTDKQPDDFLKPQTMVYTVSSTTA